MSTLCWYCKLGVGKLITNFFVLSLLVSYQSWRSGWNRTSCPLQSVISSLNSANASKWFMCPTSPTSPIRMLRTRDSCELIWFHSFMLSLDCSDRFKSVHSALFSKSAHVLIKEWKPRLQEDCGETGAESRLSETASAFIPCPSFPENHKT